MRTQRRVFEKLSETTKVELASERIELQKSTDELADEVRELSRKLVQSEKLLRDGQTIAINTRRKYDNILKEIEKAIDGYEDILKSGFLDSKTQNLLKSSLRKLQDSRSIAKGRQNKAEAINNAVKRALNR